MSGLISVEDAFGLLAEQALDLDVERAPLSEAQGRTLARDVVAAVNRPPADMSAMDGYAVRLADVRQAGARLKVIGEAPAGAPFTGTVNAGDTVRIFTGSEVPDGADHIVIQEDADREGDTLVCREASDTSRFIRKAGLDFQMGDTLLPAGARLEAGELALVAAGNIAGVDVWRRPRIGILANGNELKPPGSELTRGEIVNSNPAGLAALVRDWGGEPVDLGIAEDTLEAITARIEQAVDIDIYLPVGGASVGDHDLMRPAFAAAGFEPVFEKVAVRPGKPTWFSRRGKARVLGLPGNPASALVCAHLFLKPLVTGVAHQFACVRLARALEANGPREHFMRAAVRVSAEGSLVADPAPDQDSSLIRPFTKSAGLIRRMPGASALETGALAPVLLIGEPSIQTG